MDQHRRRVVAGGDAGDAPHLLHVQTFADDLLVLELDVELGLAVELAKGVTDLDEQVGEGDVLVGHLQNRRAQRQAIGRSAAGWE